MSSRGGRREGAGRKPLPEDQRRVQLCVYVRPETRAWLQSYHLEAGTLLDILSRALDQLDNESKKNLL